MAPVEEKQLPKKHGVPGEGMLDHTKNLPQNSAVMALCTPGGMRGPDSFTMLGNGIPQCLWTQIYRRSNLSWICLLLLHLRNPARTWNSSHTGTYQVLGKPAPRMSGMEGPVSVEILGFFLGTGPSMPGLKSTRSQDRGIKGTKFSMG